MPNKYREIAKHEELEEVEEIADEQEAEPAREATASGKPGRKGVLAKGLSAVFSGTFLTSEKSVKHIPFILFVAFIAILYIANGYYADDKFREMNKTTTQIKEAKTEFILVKSELMFMSKQSEVAKAVEPLGLMEPIAPPMKIEADSALYKRMMP
jgi:hypothetical protein